ncbi:MAG: long-chain fatty acid--CoA ligase, partial [Vampirovibrio sp.]|nr:long-chain fatty acid--CoA ligase [Vampirovibrio sp.]
DGYLFIVDRQDDLINTGGSKVYPREVEEVLYQHPAVQAVAVVGKASELYHQEVMAFIVLNDNIDGDKKQKELLLKHCRQHLADYKVPRQIEFMQDIPKGPTGKILRKQLL